MTKDKDRASLNASNRKSFHDWKQRRDIRLRAIPLEVDLENRELFFQNDLLKKFKFDLTTTNVDRLISHFVDPRDEKKVIQSLKEASQGHEKPIVFNVINPETSQKVQLEYRYEIVYVKYASTRLHGTLVNHRSPSLKSDNRKNRGFRSI